MSADKKKGLTDKDYHQIWMLVAILIGAAWYISSTSDRFKTSPKSKHGRDTIMYKDTMYVIKFKIDTAIYIDPNPDNEPIPDPRY